MSEATRITWSALILVVITAVAVHWAGVWWGLLPAAMNLPVLWLGCHERYDRRYTKRETP